MCMKKILKTTVAFVVILSLLIIAPANKAKAQFSASISIQSFYNDLAPYGQWVDDPEFGYVWIPDAGPHFRPYYSSGHWVMTRYGAMWAFDFSWGWAPFHYGRWAYSSYYGWIWVPDTVWGPAWVSWRTGGDYCGWAPLGPGISVSLSFGRGYSVPYDWWVFVPQRYCLSASFYSYRIAPERNTTYINNTTIINNTYVNNNVTYAAGPRVNDIERVTHSKVPVYNVANASRPGRTSVQSNAVNVYRPQVTNTSKGNSKPVPPAVVTRDQFVKNKGQRNGGAIKNNNVPESRQQNNLPKQQVERKQVQPQNNNVPERRQQNNPPKQQVERKQVQPQNNSIPERRQQNNTPQQQHERKQVQQQNNNDTQRRQQ